jgi:hypothetical protein
VPLVVLLTTEVAQVASAVDESNTSHGERSCAARWTLTLYPEAGEAGGCMTRVARRPARGGGSDSDRAAAEAARRARAKIRRYCAANRLNRLATLTYAGGGCHDENLLRRHIASFFRALRSRAGDGQPFPYLWVSEWHAGGHGLHVHFAIGRFVEWTQLRDTWGRGRVHIKLLGDRSDDRDSLRQSRIAARYLAKYVTKDIGASRVAGRHRYEVAQGFQPQSITCHGPTAEVAIAVAARYMGAPPAHTWFSSSDESWCASPAFWVSWS